MVGGAARETIKTHEAVIQGVVGDYLPRVTTNIMWLIWAAANTRRTIEPNYLNRGIEGHKLSREPRLLKDVMKKDCKLGVTM